MDHKNRIIILKGGDGFIPFSESGITFSYYSSYRLLVRVIRRIMRKLKLDSFYPIFYGKWKKKIKSTDLIIMFDAGIENADSLARYIKRINPGIRIVFWYWNPIKFSRSAFGSKYIDEIWTYDRFDAKKYSLKYSPQFFYKDLVAKRNNPNIDMIFLGRDKGREKVLSYIKENAQKQDLKCNFMLVKTKDDGLEYGEYLKDVANSRCVVDLVPDQFCGLTLRPLEALFLEKKLVTNYKDIVNYDFYNKDNIFIIGEDNINRLAEFIDSPYRKINKEIIDFYSYDSWLKRIEKGDSIKP